MREFQAFWGTSLATTIILCIVAAICQLIFSILMIYGSISIGQTFNRHKVMASFIAYVCLNMVLSLVRSLLQIPLLLIRTEQLDRFTSVSSILGPSFWMNLVMNGIGIVVFYLITQIIMQKKLNLD